MKIFKVLTATNDGSPKLAGKHFHVASLVGSLSERTLGKLLNFLKMFQCKVEHLKWEISWSRILILQSLESVAPFHCINRSWYSIWPCENWKLKKLNTAPKVRENYDECRIFLILTSFCSIIFGYETDLYGRLECHWYLPSMKIFLERCILPSEGFMNIKYFVSL